MVTKDGKSLYCVRAGSLLTINIVQSKDEIVEEDAVSDKPEVQSSSERVEVRSDDKEMNGRISEDEDIETGREGVINEVSAVLDPVMIPLPEEEDMFLDENSENILE